MGREVEEEPQGAAAAAMAQAGRAPARDKSSFAATCSLLSQYLRDNKAGLQGLGGLAMAPAGALRPPTTMNLLSALDAPAQEPAAAEGKDQHQRVHGKPREEAAAAAGDETRQLTIFYAGKVVVFDKFPSTKVKDLLQIANAGGDGVGMASAPAAPSLPTPSQNSLPDLPIARRNSLHRFLAKRKYRITAKAPYQVVNNSSVGAAEAPKQAAGAEKPKTLARSGPRSDSQAGDMITLPGVKRCRSVGIHALDGARHSFRLLISGNNILPSVTRFYF